MTQTMFPAACTVCGAVFPLRTVFFGAGFNVQHLVMENVQDQCPRCGGLAYAAEGVFQIADQVVTAIYASDVTKEMLAAFARAIKEAQAKSSDSETLAKAVEKINPEFGKLVRQASSKTGLYAALLAVTLAAINSCSVEVKLDANRLIDQVMNAPPAPSVKLVPKK